MLFVRTNGRLHVTHLLQRNGSLACERIRDDYGLDWGQFNRLLEQTAPGNDGGIMLPWFEPEIVRGSSASIRRFNLDSNNAAANCRAIVEAQMMSVRLHSQWMKGDAEEDPRQPGAVL